MTIKVFLVEDSPIARIVLNRIFSSSPDIEVVGVANSGLEALKKIPTVNPDVICTDLHMPQMNGVEFISEVMAIYPRPILVISASVQEDDSDNIFEVLDAGAVDVFPKPPAGLKEDVGPVERELIYKIKILSGVKVFTKRRKSTPQRKNKQTIKLSPFSSFTRTKLIVIGASTGGPKALQEIFTHLPSDFPVPVICTQHISMGFLPGLIDWLSKSCRLPIEIARPGELPVLGKIYFAPEDRHLEFDPTGRFICSNSFAVDGHRPSVTVTFKSAAKVYGKRVAGILLTGMGRDGAKGMEAIFSVGGLTIAQDKATSVIFGMPKEAIDLGAAKEVLPIEAIAPRLLALLSSN